MSKRFVVLVPFNTYDENDVLKGLSKYTIQGGYFGSKKEAIEYANTQWMSALVARVREPLTCQEDKLVSKQKQERS